MAQIIILLSTAKLLRCYNNNTIIIHENSELTWRQAGAERNRKSRITCFRKPDSADTHDGH